MDMVFEGYLWNVQSPRIARAACNTYTSNLWNTYPMQNISFDVFCLTYYLKWYGKQNMTIIFSLGNGLRKKGQVWEDWELKKFEKN